MSDFAKIVRASDGAQVLFYKGQDEDGRPQLFQVTYFDGVIANLNFSFAENAWSMLDAAFDRAGLEQANTIRGLLGKFVPEPGPAAAPPQEFDDAPVVSDLLALVGIDAPDEVVATWSREDREAASEWASATHVAASDNDIEVPPRPAFLPQPWTGPTQGEGIWETNPTPMVAKAPAPSPNPIPNPAFGAPKPKNHNPKG